MNEWMVVSLLEARRLAGGITSGKTLNYETVEGISSLATAGREPGNTHSNKAYGQRFANPAELKHRLVWACDLTTSRASGTTSPPSSLPSPFVKGGLRSSYVSEKVVRIRRVHTLRVKY